MPTSPSPPLPRRYTKSFQQAQKQKRINEAQQRENQIKIEQQKIEEKKNAEKNAEQQNLISRYEKGEISFQEYLKLFPEKIEKTKYGGSNTTQAGKDYITYLSSKGKDTREAERTLLPESGRTYIGIGKPYEKKETSIQKEPLFINGEPVVGGYSSTSGEEVFLTYKNDYKQIPASFEKPPVSYAELPVTKEAPKETLTTDYAIGESEGQRFAEYIPKKENVIKAEFSKEINTTQQREKYLDRFGAFRPIEEARLTITPQIERVGKNLLLGAKDISEAPFIVGSESFRGIADIGRSAGGFIGRKEYLAFFGTKLKNPVEPYEPIFNENDYISIKERGAIIGGVGVSVLPYFAGGFISGTQRFADIGSAYLESPSKAFTLAGVSVASTVALNQLGAVSRLVKGQLGGTIAGSVGFAKNFEDFSNVGGKILQVGLLVPYASQELPQFYDAFTRADTEQFRQSFARVQRTYAPLYIGGIVGQKISTGFTLFSKSPNAIVTGGLNAPTETLARKRLIANVFDAKPGTPAYQNKLLYEAQGFTKQKFLENYETIFTGKQLNPRVNEFDASKIEAISKNAKAQKVVLEYFKKNTTEFAIYGSGVQGPQLSGVKSRLIGDVDIVAKNPNEFGMGLIRAFRKAGFTKNEFSVFTNKADEFSIAGQGGAKFINIHSYKGNPLFPQIESVSGIIPSKVFTKTPSGINITNIRFQGERKIVGGFIDLREKDIADVTVISKGIVNNNTVYQKDFFKFGKTMAIINGQPIIYNNQFGLSEQGKKLLEGELPIKETGLRVRDIMRINPNSQPVKDISKITGIPEKELVSKLRQLPVEGFTPIEKIKYGPNVGALTGPTEKGNLGLKLRKLPPKFSNQTFEESVIVHELEHAGERIAGITSGRPTNNFNYFTSGSEQRAYAVQERFLEARGQTLPSDILFRTGVKNNSALISKVTNESVKTYTAEEIKRLYESAIRLTTKNTKYEYPIPNKGSAYYYIPEKYPKYLTPYSPKYASPGYNVQPVVPYLVPYTPKPYNVPTYRTPYNPYKPSPYSPAPYTPPYNPTPYNSITYTPTPTPYVPSVPPKQTLYVPKRPNKPVTSPPPKKRFFGEKIVSNLGKAFVVQTKKGGKIITLKPKLTFEDATNYGANIADRTARASFRVVEAEGFAKPIGISASRTKFTLSKQKNGFLVEPRKLRLNVRSERSDVSSGRLKKFKRFIGL